VAQPPPHSPSPSAPTARRSYGAGASILWCSTSAPSAPRLSPRPPDFDPFPHIFSRLGPERKSHKAKVPRSESSREWNGQGTKEPGSKSTREWFGQGANRPGSYWPIRSGSELDRERKGSVPFGCTTSAASKAFTESRPRHLMSSVLPRRCNELTIHLDLAFAVFKRFAVVGYFDVAHIKPQ